MAFNEDGIRWRHFSFWERNMPEPDWNERYERQIAEQKQRAKGAIAALLPQLQSLGVAQVTIPYDGYGDEGAFQTPIAFAGDKEIQLPEELNHALCDAAIDLLPEGWQDSNGSFGEVELNVPTRKLLRDHNWRVEESEPDPEEHQL
ncbi:MAG: hypothetical protein KY475_06515 [Planctomycetes bacterium]|nr:hypothetical protein [Planctomycetota bacterium]